MKKILTTNNKTYIPFCGLGAAGTRGSWDRTGGPAPWGVGRRVLTRGLCAKLRAGGVVFVGGWCSWLLVLGEEVGEVLHVR